MKKNSNYMREYFYIFYIYIGLLEVLVLALFYSHTNHGAVLNKTELIQFLGYDVYMQNLHIYLTHRILNIIPLVYSLLTFFVIGKIAVDGNCPLLIKKVKNLTLGRLLSFNFMIVVIGLMPFAMELTLTLFLMVSVGYYFLEKMRVFFVFIDKKIDDAYFCIPTK